MFVEQMAPALVLGLLFGGLIERFVPREYVSILLSQRRKRTILKSVLLGFLMSACSHGILALAVQLYKKGAPAPVVVSFLLASPWANLPITLLLFGLFGMKALYIVFSALLVALVTGLAFQGLERRGWIEKNPYTLDVETYAVVPHLTKRIAGYRFSASRLSYDVKETLKGSLSLARMTLPWIFIGVALSGLASTFIPESFFRRYMGHTVGGLFATLGLATVIEVCSEGTAPLAFELFRQTGAFGNAFVFLMAGVVTDYTEIGLLWSNVGRRTALWLPVVTVPQVLLLGYVANRLF
jgi:uncharacterized membrane protein YraQ (UPF0718 family)